MAITAADQYIADGVVCPLILRTDLFTIAAVDNIDHNSSSTTSHDAFHDTGISLFQHKIIGSPGKERKQAELQPRPANKQILHFQNLIQI